MIETTGLSEGGCRMALYLTHFDYTPETWKALMSAPRDRREELRPFFEAAGARLIDMYFTFGEKAGFILSEGSNVSAAAISICVTASGAVKGVETTVLMTVDEMLEALAKAQELPYRAPTEMPVAAG
jgi:uncharacterized protein with GYD domain